MLKYHILQKRPLSSAPLQPALWILACKSCSYSFLWHLTLSQAIRSLPYGVASPLCWCFWGNGAREQTATAAATEEVIRWAGWQRFPSLFGFPSFAPGMQGGFIRFAFSCIDKKVLFNSPTPGYLYTEKKEYGNKKDNGQRNMVLKGGCDWFQLKIIVVGYGEQKRNIS